MGKKIYRDINVRGQVFADVRAICDHFGLSRQSVIATINAGNADRIGLGSKIGRRPQRVRIRGEIYSSAKIAAEAINVSESAINLAIEEGRTETVGLRVPRPPTPISKPFRVAHLSWPSMQSADRALGFSPGYIAHTLKNKRRCAVQRIIAAAMAYEGKRMVS